MICIEYYFRKATIDDFDFIFDLKKKNKGIGTDILNNLLIKNKQKGLKTKLKVFKNSPAKKLYERLGFSVYGENESHYQMEKM